MDGQSQKYTYETTLMTAPPRFIDAASRFSVLIKESSSS
jgi:hypothetical protein